jgi:hypothetical protein
MTITNKSELYSTVKKSINPKDETFDFSLWSKAVRKQMIQTLEKKLGSKSLTI